jgi:hypothetical protein
MRYKALPRFNWRLVAYRIRCGSKSNQTSKSLPKTVGDLRKVTAWPENCAITTPPDGDPESRVRVSKVSAATRVSPKP